MPNDTKFIPLTPEQLERIEKHNKLLAAFSEMIEHLEQVNPGIDLPNTLLFAAFSHGANSAMKLTVPIIFESLNTTKQELIELNQMMMTYKHQMEQESNGEQ